jgi:hypothetical protein
VDICGKTNLKFITFARSLVSVYLVVTTKLMNKIIYPTLDLFLYHQREGLTENEADIATNHANFWSNLPKNLKVELAEEAKAENTEYVRLLEFSEAAKRQKQFFFTASLGGYPIEASYYPIRLNDTYALLFDLSLIHI